MSAPVNNEIKQLAAHCRLHDHINKTAILVHLQASPASGLHSCMRHAQMWTAFCSSRAMLGHSPLVRVTS